MSNKKVVNNKRKINMLIHGELISITNELYSNYIKIQEPDYIANLVINLTPKITKILKSIDNKSNYSFTSVFCHQAPKVDISQSKNPEIGDILFVYVDRFDRNKVKYNSMLLQAKVTKNRSVTEKGHQYILYSQWPKFKYYKSRWLSGKEIDIYPKTYNDGGKYLLIDNTYPILSSVYGTAPSINPISISKDLSSDLVDFLTFTSGKSFDSISKRAKDPWTDLIWDLIEYSLVNVFKRTRTFGQGISRNYTYGFNGVNETSDIKSIIEKKDKRLPYSVQRIISMNDGLVYDDENVNSGVSLVLIERESLE